MVSLTLQKALVTFNFFFWQNRSQLAPKVTSFQKKKSWKATGQLPFLPSNPSAALMLLWFHPLPFLLPGGRLEKQWVPQKSLSYFLAEPGASLGSAQVQALAAACVKHAYVYTGKVQSLKWYNFCYTVHPWAQIIKGKKPLFTKNPQLSVFF